jgi:hypothetical protein
MNIYVMIWHPYIGEKVIERSVVLDSLDKIPEIENWRANIGAIFIASKSSASEISDSIRQKIPGLMHMVIPIDLAHMQGWADRDTWEFILKPRPAGEP